MFSFHFKIQSNLLLFVSFSGTLHEEPFEAHHQSRPDCRRRLREPVQQLHHGGGQQRRREDETGLVITPKY